MAGAKEIRSKIASVQNTQKITKALEMVAASKMRKSQDRMAASRPYAETMRKVIGHLAHGNLAVSYTHLDVYKRQILSRLLILKAGSLLSTGQCDPNKRSQ